jgi:YQGE family putative transporter
MLLIDTVSAIEDRNQYAYIFSHEIGLFAGRLMGCGLFILLAIFVSHRAALKYALPTIAILQCGSIWLASHLLGAAARAKSAPMPAHPEIVEVVHR